MLEESFTLNRQRKTPLPEVVKKTKKNKVKSGKANKEKQADKEKP